jgi:xylulokinase
MTHSTSRADLALAVLEGVGFAFADGLDALHATGMMPKTISLIGGGARSEYWRQMLADIFTIPLEYRLGGDVGPGLGAARLARLGVDVKKTIADVCPVSELVQAHQPDHARHLMLNKKRKTYQALYPALQPLF